MKVLRDIADLSPTYFETANTFVCRFHRAGAAADGEAFFARLKLDKGKGGE